MEHRCIAPEHNCSIQKRVSSNCAAPRNGRCCFLRYTIPGWILGWLCIERRCLVRQTDSKRYQPLCTQWIGVSDPRWAVLPMSQTSEWPNTQRITCNLILHWPFSRRCPATACDSCNKNVCVTLIACKEVGDSMVFQKNFSIAFVCAI